MNTHKLRFLFCAYPFIPSRVGYERFTFAHPFPFLPRCRLGVLKDLSGLAQMVRIDVKRYVRASLDRRRAASAVPARSMHTEFYVYKLSSLCLRAIIRVLCIAVLLDAVFNVCPEW